MASTLLDLERARRAKEKGKQLLGSLASFSGIGLTQREGHYAVKVNFETEPDNEAAIPQEIDGVPVVFEVVGQIRRQ
ncbi:MAG: hypothetical protein U0002_21440 [Thermoanaerobaculia bacterium]